MHVSHQNKQKKLPDQKPAVRYPVFDFGEPEASITGENQRRVFWAVRNVYDFEPKMVGQKMPLKGAGGKCY